MHTPCAYVVYIYSPGRKINLIQIINGQGRCYVNILRSDDTYEQINEHVTATGSGDCRTNSMVTVTESLQRFKEYLCGLCDNKT